MKKGDSFWTTVYNVFLLRSQTKYTHDIVKMLVALSSSATLFFVSRKESPIDKKFKLLIFLSSARRQI